MKLPRVHGKRGTEKPPAARRFSISAADGWISHAHHALIPTSPQSVRFFPTALHNRPISAVPAKPPTQRKQAEAVRTLYSERNSASSLTFSYIQSKKAISFPYIPILLLILKIFSKPQKFFGAWVFFCLSSSIHRGCPSRNPFLHSVSPNASCIISDVSQQPGG
jgi:hypothetical protein